MNKSYVKSLKDEKNTSEYLVENSALNYPESNYLDSKNLESDNLDSKRLNELINEAKRMFNKILNYSLSPATMKPHEFEKTLFTLLLGLGRIFLEIFFNTFGNGNEGKSITTDDGRVLKRYRKRSRDYVSVFGKLQINRWLYWSKGSMGVFPLDERLNLPERSYSYHLQELLTGNCADLTYDSTLKRIEDMFAIKLSPRSIIDILQDVNRHSENFRDTQAPPPAADEGEIQVVSADGKGIPMRKEHLAEKKPRLKKGEKNQKKKMSLLTAVFSVDRNIRTADDILKGEKDKKSSRSRCKRYRGCLGDKLQKNELMKKVSSDAGKREAKHQVTKVFLSDGEKFLRKLQQDHFPDHIPILDIYHVSEKLWEYAHCFFKEGSVKSAQHVNLLYRMLLEGNTTGCIYAMKASGQRNGVSENRRKKIESIVGYLEENKDRMRYNKYIAKGLPIGSGVIESSCKVLVKQRMEGAGMRWSKSGADAMLSLRAISLNGDLSEYFNHHIRREHKRLYDKTSTMILAESTA